MMIMAEEESVRRCSVNDGDFYDSGGGGRRQTLCSGKALTLFGVKIEVSDDESIRKVKSMGNLLLPNIENGGCDSGYLSDGLVESRKNKSAAASQFRKKGVPWTEEEHRCFLVGLEKVGRGDWRGISRKFVPSRTSTQVASHAQKYFMRRATIDKKKRRPSLFDMAVNELRSIPQEHPTNGASISHPTSILPLVSLKKASEKVAIEIQGQGSASAPVATSERPPFPCTPNFMGQGSTSERPSLPRTSSSIDVPDFIQMPYMVTFSRTGPSFPQPKNGSAPAISFVPVMSFPNRSYVCLSNSPGQFATCAPIMTRPPRGLHPCSLPHVP